MAGHVVKYQLALAASLTDVLRMGGRQQWSTTRGFLPRSVRNGLSSPEITQRLERCAVVLRHT